MKITNLSLIPLARAIFYFYSAFLCMHCNDRQDQEHMQRGPVSQLIWTPVDLECICVLGSENFSSRSHVKIYYK
jgi:hypothetical protein